MPTADDYGNSVSLATNISIGATTNGNIELAYDTDWFGITLSPMSSYTFNLDGSSLSDPMLDLYDSNGNFLQSNDDFNGLNSQIDYIPPSAGRYYLVAHGFSDRTGTYSLRTTQTSGPTALRDDYTNTVMTTGAINVNSAVSGEVEDTYDSDWFRVMLSANTSYTFNLNGRSLQDTYLELYNESGQLLTVDDDSGIGLDSEISFAPTASGTYYLGARGFSSYTGSYDLSITQGATIAPVADDYANTISTTGTLAVGSNVTGVIESVADQDWFQISLNARTRYQFGLNASGMTGGIAAPYLRLFDSNGDIVGDASGAVGGDAQLSYTPVRSGTFYVSAGGHEDAMGAYSLTAVGRPISTRDDFTANIRTTGRIAVGGEADGSLERARDVDWFRVPLQAYSVQNPIAYIIGVESEEVGLEDFSVTIRNNRGQLLATVPSEGDNAYTFRARTTGAVFISVQARNGIQTGAYTVYVEEADRDEGDSGTTSTSTSRSRLMAETLNNTSLSGTAAGSLYNQNNASDISRLSVLAG